MTVGGGADELEFVAAQLAAAKGPAAIFGTLTGTESEQLAQARATYRRMAVAVHPDRHKNDPRAVKAFTDLQTLYIRQQALCKGEPDPAIVAKTPTVPVVLKTRTREYTLGAELAQGDLAMLYHCIISEGSVESAGVLKIARDPADNDLLEREARILRLLATEKSGRGGKQAPPYFPRLKESFLHRDSLGVSRRVNVFPVVVTEAGPIPTEAWYTLEEVRAQYPRGLDPRQVAWMWRRILIALAHAHENAVLHGGVLPSHILVQPESHGLLVTDWCASLQGEIVDPSPTGRDPYLGYRDLLAGAPAKRPVEKGKVVFSGRHIPFASPAYERWYPARVLARGEPTIAVDLEMAARCAAYLLGGNGLGATIPSSVHADMIRYFMDVPRHKSAWAAYEDFEDLIQQLWGRRTFVPFSMAAHR
jgi:serine/threonine protein kinase